MDISLFFLNYKYHMEPLELAKKSRIITISYSPTQQGEEIIQKLYNTLT